MVSAGEASGDQHAAAFIRHLQALDSSTEFVGMGGDATRLLMRQIVDASDLAVVGLFEVLAKYSELRRALNQMKTALAEEKPDLLVCVDYKEFNFKLAKFAKSIGVKVLFYVSPQVWAWREDRVKAYGEVIDHMAVIFPFETAYYERENIPCTYVGHPSLDSVKPTASVDSMRMVLGIDDSQPVLGLLPGSRANEVKRLLPDMLGAANILQSKYPKLQVVLLQASSVKSEWLQEYELGQVKVVNNQTYNALQCCDAVITASGTASLETAILGVPLAIIYRLSPLTYLLSKWLVKTPFIGLPNIVAGRRIATEFLQSQISPSALAEEAERLLFSKPMRQKMLADLDEVRDKLGEGGGSRNLAELAHKMLINAL